MFGVVACDSPAALDVQLEARAGGPAATLHILLVSVAGRSRALQRNDDLAAFSASHNLGGGATIGRDLQVSHAAQNTENLTRRAFRVVGQNGRDLIFAYDDLEGRRLCSKEHGSILRGDVGH